MTFPDRDVMLTLFSLHIAHRGIVTEQGVFTEGEAGIVALDLGHLDQLKDRGWVDMRVEDEIKLTDKGRYALVRWGKKYSRAARQAKPTAQALARSAGDAGS